MAHLPDHPSALALHIRPILREGGHQQAAIRLLAQERLRGCHVDCQVEEARLREAVLHALHPDQGDKLSLDLHLPCPQGSTQGEPGNPMRKLRLQRMCFQRLSATTRKECEKRLLHRFMTIDAIDTLRKLPGRTAKMRTPTRTTAPGLVSGRKNLEMLKLAAYFEWIAKMCLKAWSENMAKTKYRRKVSE